MEEDDRRTPGHHHISGDGAVDAPAQQTKRLSAGTHGQPARPGDLFSEKGGGTLPDFDPHGEFGMTQIDFKAVEAAENFRAQVCGQIHRGEGIAFVLTRGCHSERDGAIADGADPGEPPGHKLQNRLGQRLELSGHHVHDAHVDNTRQPPQNGGAQLRIAFAFHKQLGPAALYFVNAVRLQMARGVIGQLLFELGTIAAFQGDFGVACDQSLGHMQRAVGCGAVGCVRRSEDDTWELSPGIKEAPAARS